MFQSPRVKRRLRVAALMQGFLILASLLAPVAAFAASPQTITFSPLNDKTYDPGLGVPLVATATSGLTVTFSSLTTSVCTVSGTMVIIQAAGTCTVQADQAGDSSWDPAAPVTQGFTVNKADPTIDVTGWTGAYDGSPHGASGTATGVNSEDLSSDLDLGASYTDVPGGTANWAFTDTTGNYNDASGSVDIVINKADPTIDVTGWTGAYDGSPHGASGTATGVNSEDLSSDLDLGASYTDVPGGTANWAFTDTTGNYNDASGSVDIVINKADPTIDVTGWTGAYDGSPHGASGTATGVNSEDLSSDLDLGASYTDVPGGTANWAFTDTTGNYNDASGSVDIVIGTGNQSITSGALGDKTYGDAPFAVSASASSGLTVTFSSLTTSVCTVSGTTVTIQAAGTCTVQADQAGDSSWDPAAPVTRSFTVNKAAQAIDFGVLSNVVFGSGGVVLSATSESGLPVTYSSLTPLICTVSDTTVTLVGAGTCTIQADQAGDANHDPAAPVTRSFLVLAAQSSLPPTSTGFSAAPTNGSSLASSALLFSFLGIGAFALLMLLTGRRRPRARGRRP